MGRSRGDVSATMCGCKRPPDIRLLACRTEFDDHPSPARIALAAWLVSAWLPKRQFERLVKSSHFNNEYQRVDGHRLWIIRHLPKIEPDANMNVLPILFALSA